MPRVLEPADTCRTATTNSSSSISSNIHSLLLLLLSLLTLHNVERTPQFILVPKKQQLCEETKKNSGSQRKNERERERERERSPSLAATTNDKSSCWRVQLGPSIDDPIPGINSYLKLAIASLDREARARARRCQLFEARQWSHCKCKTEFCRYLSFSTSLSCKCNSISTPENRCIYIDILLHQECVLCVMDFQNSCFVSGQHDLFFNKLVSL